MALIRQSRPDSGPGFQVKVRQEFKVVASSLGSGNAAFCSLRAGTKGTHALIASCCIDHRGVSKRRERTWPRARRQSTLDCGSWLSGKYSKSSSPRSEVATQQLALSVPARRERAVALIIGGGSRGARVPRRGLSARNRGSDLGR